MIKHNQQGAVNGLGLSLFLAVLFLVGALGFGAWAFSGMQDYKNNTEDKIATAVAAARKDEAAKRDAFNAEANKSPFRVYDGPEAYGSLVVNYPKTWSAYVDDTGEGQALVDGYFNPNVVPSITDQDSVYSLRVKVLTESYAETVTNFTALQTNNLVTITAYSLPKLPKVVGIKVTGKLNGDDKTGTMVVLPLRSQTLEISTDGTQFLNDFEKNILPNLSFIP